jgi:L-ascorbate metabolism protein UlaG (beta-lactamase superfamily)
MRHAATRLTRRRFLRSAALGAGAALLPGCASPMTAANPGQVRPRYPVSDHCDGRRFFNPRHHVDRGWLEVMKWKLTTKATPWPARVAVPPATAPARPVAPALAATWIGHATYLVQTGAGAFITDPVFSERASPVGFAGPRRVHAPGVALGDLPQLDAVLLTHDHYDHCDLASLRRLGAAHPAAVAVTPLNNGDLFLAAGWAPGRIIELDWWERHALPGGLEVQVTPARHWSNRASGARNGRLWGGFRVGAAGRAVQVVGDTAYDVIMFAEIRTRCGAPDLALVPIGAYEPRWFMAEQHCDPAEAVQLHRDLGAGVSLAKHWGTFPLTDEGREAPAEALAAARAAAGLAERDFRILAPGATAVV